MRIIALLLVITACAAGAAAAPSEITTIVSENASDERDATTPEGIPGACTNAGAAASEEEEVFFPSVLRAVPYLGPDAKEAFAFRWYNATELVLGWGLATKILLAASSDAIQLKKSKRVSMTWRALSARPYVEEAHE